MKNFIILVLVLLVIGFLLKSHSASSTTDDNGGPITNPVYAEVRFAADIQDRNFHLVAIGAARDQADCKHMLADLPDRMRMGRKPDGTPIWRLESSDCKQQLDERSAKLFDNKPTFVNYVSASPGAPGERETRLIIWGVTAREGELVCDLANHIRETWKGTVSCVRALPSG